MSMMSTITDFLLESPEYVLNSGHFKRLVTGILNGKVTFSILTADHTT